MGIEGGVPFDMQDTSFKGWMLHPTDVSRADMNFLALQIFSTPQGQRWLEGLMWMLMFSTPTDQSDGMALRDLGKQDVVRLIVHMVHAGNQALVQGGSDDGGSDSTGYSIE